LTKAECLFNAIADRIAGRSWGCSIRMSRDREPAKKVLAVCNGRHLSIFNEFVRVNPARSTDGDSYRLRCVIGEISMKKVEVQDAKLSPSKTLRALKAGPHGKVITTSGEIDAKPNPHRPTDGSNNR
jgi:hypothetical protein